MVLSLRAGRVETPGRSSKHLVAEGSFCRGQAWIKEGQLTRSMTSNTGEDARTEDGIGRREEVEDLEESLESLKREKVKAKSALTRAKKQLLEVVEEMDLPSRRQVRDGKAKLDSTQERVQLIRLQLLVISHQSYSRLIQKSALNPCKKFSTNV